jgi:hypothetical protein
MQWLQNPVKTNGDNLTNLRRETGRSFRGKKEGISERKINKLETHSEKKMYQRII